MTSQTGKRLTRRNFIKSSAVLLFGTGLVPPLHNFYPISISAQTNPKRIYIAPDDHTDYFWTADEDTYRQVFLEMIDYYLDLADQTELIDNEPPEHQSRWNCDGSFWIWTYEKNKPTVDFERLIDRIRSRHFSFPLNALVVCFGGVPVEAVLRGMYYAGSIERRYNLKVTMAISMENQTLPYGLGALWAGAGAKYSWKGICNCASQIPDAWDREHDIYWWVGSDGSRILMKWNSLLDGPGVIGMGNYAEARDPSAVVDYVDTDAAFIARYPYNVIGAFGKGWDDLKTLTDEFVTVAKNKTTADRLVIVSNEEDFFEDFDATYGGSLPSVSATFGNEWDLACASLAEVSARVKRVVEKMRGAEALATLVSLQNTNFMSGRENARDLAWMNLGLYWEHDFGTDVAQFINGRINWQRRITDEIETYVDTLHTDAIAALGGMIQKSGSELRFFVFNPLNWTRTDTAHFPYAGSGPIHVIDISTNSEVPSQLITLNSQQYLRVLAQDVPSVGYKVFEVRSGAGQSYSDAATVNGNIIENQYYQITVADRGAITSLLDKTQGNREFAKSINGRLINDLGPSSGSLQVENTGPVSVTMLATAPDPLNHTTRITLIRDSKRVDIRNDINQNFDDIYTWGFGFDLDNPDVWHEEVGAIIRAKLLEQGGHYSPRNARYDWLTLNHFADISDNNSSGVTLSNADCYFMKLGNSTPGILDSNTSQLSPLVGGRISGYGLPSQGGDTHFLQRFALQTHADYDPVSSMKFALEHQNPLITGEVTGGSAYPETNYSLVNISDPNILLWALKPADEGLDNGIITRLWNLANTSKNFSLTIEASPILNAQHVSHIETPISNAVAVGGALTESIDAHQLKTFSLNSNNNSPPGPYRAYMPIIAKGN